MKRKKLLALGFVLIFAITMVAGCAPAAEEEPVEEPAEEPVVEEPAEEPMQAALLTSGPINDGGWNMLAYEGLLNLQDQYGFEVSYTENVKQDDQEAIMNDYARKGYDVIIGHGFEYGDAILAVAANHPDVHFINIGGMAVADNVASASFQTGEMGYVLGVMAGRMTETNKVGFVGAMEIPTIAADVEAFKAAIAEVNPDCDVMVTYTGSWVDIAAGKEAAIGQIDAGADIIYGVGDACDAGAIQACEEADHLVKFIGWSADMSSLGPNTVITSGYQSISTLIGNVVDTILDGTFEGKSTPYGIADGVQYFATWNDDLITPEDKDATIAVFNEFMDGERVTEFPSN
ncbi:BMP family protein [Clostridia bacterium]|nr:BMP family protein [Clostridia bacterium]